jgi:hypothetical protein
MKLFYPQAVYLRFSSCNRLSPLFPHDQGTRAVTWTTSAILFSSTGNNSLARAGPGAGARAIFRVKGDRTTSLDFYIT